MAASGQLGAIFSGADEACEPMLVEYGEKVGVAFQLADDVIDVTGLKVKSGKSPGTDLREGVPTLPVLLLRNAARDGDLPPPSNCWHWWTVTSARTRPWPRPSPHCGRTRSPRSPGGRRRLGRRGHCRPWPRCRRASVKASLTSFADAVVDREV